MRPKFLVLLIFLAACSADAQWPAPKSPVIPEADGYSLIPDAAVRPAKNHVYKTVFDATRFPADSSSPLLAVKNAASELNGFGVEGVPRKNWKFVMAFHSRAIDGILDNDHYRAKYHIDNPNLKLLAELRKNGVELYVCGQNMAELNLDRSAISPDVTVASDALIVLMTFQNKGYALLSF